MILKIKGADGNWYGIPSIKGETGPRGPIGPRGLGGERGLAFYRVNSDLVSSMEPYPFSSFAIPEDFTPKINDLVLYNDGNLGYIYSVDTTHRFAQVALGVEGTLKGADGYSPTVSVSKVDGVATIKITDKNGTKEVQLYDGASDAGGGGDWNVNSPAAAGYIKNRTHHKVEVPSGTVIDTTTVYYPDNGHSVTIDVTAGIFFAGVKYTVSWMNNPYELVCYENSNGDPTLGNGSLSDSTLPDTGEPFCLVNPQGGSSLIVYRSLANQPNNILKVESEGKTIYHQLDPKYIEDMYYKEWVESLPVTEMELREQDGMMIATIPNPDFQLKEGLDYKILWNGTEYTCTAVEMFTNQVAVGNIGALSGGESTGEPFLIVSGVLDDGHMIMIVAFDGSTTLTLGVKESLPHKIKDQYLPEIESFDFTPYVETFTGYNPTVEIEGLGTAVRRAFKKGFMRIKANIQFGNLPGRIYETVVPLAYDEKSDQYSFSITKVVRNTATSQVTAHISYFDIYFPMTDSSSAYLNYYST